MQITCSRFSDEFAGLNGEQNLNISLFRLYHSAITVGAPSLRAALPTSWQALHFAFHKISAIGSVIEINGDTVKLPDNYDNLDPQEKRVLSFWTGMIMAKLVAQQKLNIPWLCHAYTLKKEGRLTLDPEGTQSLPDFVGLDNHLRWHIMEAKCNENIANTRIKENPDTDQTRKILTIDNQKPKTRTYCFTVLRPHYRIILIDPPTENGVKYRITPKDIQDYYYRPFYEIFHDKTSLKIESRNGVIYRQLGIDDHKQMISIGIVEDVLTQLKNQQIVTALDPQSTTDEYIGSDGIAIRIGAVE